MKKKLRILKLIKKPTTRPYKKCPLGGWCWNPLCMLGCVEDD